jgi:hypothetical protein
LASRTSRTRTPGSTPRKSSMPVFVAPPSAPAPTQRHSSLNYYVKPPISDLFVEESQFDGKGFKMINHIDKYFNPSGAVDSLGIIFDLINVKQASDESVITLEAWLSRLFASLKLAGRVHAPGPPVPIPRGGLQDFCLGCHSLPSSTLQSVVNQCTAYDKDP